MELTIVKILIETRLGCKVVQCQITELLLNVSGQPKSSKLTGILKAIFQMSVLLNISTGDR